MDAEIGGEKPTARRPAGEAADPQTLYPSEPGKPSAAKKATRQPAKPQPVVKPADLSQLKPGDVVPAAVAPRIVGMPFTLSCSVATTQPDAILVAHGGLAVGYALHLRGGRAVFTIHDKGGDTHVETAFPASADSQRIVASLAEDGTLTLQVADQPAVTAKAHGPFSRQPAEDFCVGHDNRKPVTSYTAKDAFLGRITDLRVTMP